MNQVLALGEELFYRYQKGSHRRFLLRAFLALSIPGVAFLAVMAGRLDGGLAAVATISGLCGVVLEALAPTLLLDSLYFMAPLVWGLGKVFSWSGMGPKLNLPMLIGFLIICAFAPEMLLKDPDAGIEKIRKLVLLLALGCVPAIFFARDFSTGVGTYLRIMAPFVVMLATRRYLQNEQDVLRTVKLMAGSLASTAVLLAVAFARDELWVTFDGYRHLGGMNLPPQSVASYLAVMVAVLGLGFLTTRKLGYVLLLFPVLVALYLTLNRTAWLGTALLLFMFVRKISARWALLLVIACFLLGFTNEVGTAFLRHSEGLETAEQLDKVLSGRLTVDLINIDHYLESSVSHKLLGIGFLQALEVTDSALGDQLEIHSDYLAFLIEAGVLSLLAYVAVLVALWLRARRGLRNLIECVPRWTCASAEVLIVAFIVMGVPRAWYHEVLGNLYVFGLMGMMLWVSSPVSIKGARQLTN
jgi:O-antigen ligase/polysaccharide polymerase Wzy-like membrane protein